MHGHLNVNFFFFQEQMTEKVRHVQVSKCGIIRRQNVTQLWYRNVVFTLKRIWTLLFCSCFALRAVIHLIQRNLDLISSPSTLCVFQNILLSSM